MTRQGVHATAVINSVVTALSVLTSLVTLLATWYLLQEARPMETREDTPNYLGYPLLLTPFSTVAIVFVRTEEGYLALGTFLEVVCGTGVCGRCLCPA